MNLKNFFLQLPSNLFNPTLGFYGLTLLLYLNTYRIISNSQCYSDYLLDVTFAISTLLILYIFPKPGRWLLKCFRLIIGMCLSPWDKGIFFKIFDWNDSHEYSLETHIVMSEAIESKNSLLKQLCEEIEEKRNKWEMTQNAFFIVGCITLPNFYYKGFIYEFVGNKEFGEMISIMIAIVCFYMSIVERSFKIHFQSSSEIFSFIHKKYYSLRNS